MKLPHLFAKRDTSPGGVAGIALTAVPSEGKRPTPLEATGGGRLTGGAAGSARPADAPPPRKRHGSSGSLTRRMIGISALWIVLLLGLGGYALDRVLTSAITSNFDSQLDYMLTAMIASSEIGPDGEVLFNRPPADQRFLEPYSGLYYQISGGTADPFPSRSLWDRRLNVAPHVDTDAHYYDSDEFPTEKLRIIERDVRLPNSPIRWRFQVAQNRDILDE